MHYYEDFRPMTHLSWLLECWGKGDFGLNQISALLCKPQMWFMRQICLHACYEK